MIITTYLSQKVKVSMACLGAYYLPKYIMKSYVSEFCIINWTSNCFSQDTEVFIIFYSFDLTIDADVGSSNAKLITSSSSFKKGWLKLLTF